MSLSKTNHGAFLEADIADAHVRFNRDTIRRILRLPKASKYQRHGQYDPVPSDEELLADIRNLGYDALLNYALSFERQHLVRPWNTLFAILNRCLSPKHSGWDRCNTGMLRILHGVAYHRHYDYVQIVWTDIVDQLKIRDNPNKRHYIPYLRWFPLIIRHYQRTIPTILPRHPSELCNIPKIKYIVRDSSDSAVDALPIPLDLLDFADATDKEVIEYKAKYYPRNDQTSSDASDHHSATDSTDDSTSRSSSSTSHHSGSHEDTQSQRPSRGIDSEDEDDDDDEDDTPLVRKSSSHHREVRTKLFHAQNTPLPPSRPSASAVSPSRPEGETLSSSIPLNRDETSSPQSSHGRTTHIGREVASGSSHLAVVVHSPTTHAHTQSSHLSDSQQLDTSVQHGDIAQLLSPPHLEVRDIESSGPSPHTTAHPSNTGIVQSPNTLNNSRTQVESVPSLCDLPRTITVPPQRVSPQVIGSPIPADITPAGSIGHTVVSPTTVVLTSNLRDPGVTHSIPILSVSNVVTHLTASVATHSSGSPRTQIPLSLGHTVASVATSVSTERLRGPGVIFPSFVSRTELDQILTSFRESLLTDMQDLIQCSSRDTGSTQMTTSHIPPPNSQTTPPTSTPPPNTSPLPQTLTLPTQTPPSSPTT